MAYFSAGVLLGLVASYFLFYRLRSGRGFSQLLQKEINLNGYLLQIEQAGQRMDHLEERCCRLERKLSGTARAKNFSKSDLSGRIGPGRKPEQVLELWEGGWELSDIVRRTGLSRGEIELIVSLQERH